MKKKHFLFTLKVILLTFYSVAGHNPIRCFLPKNCLHTIAMIAVTFKVWRSRIFSIWKLKCCVWKVMVKFDSDIVVVVLFLTGNFHHCKKLLVLSMAFGAVLVSFSRIGDFQALCFSDFSFVPFYSVFSFTFDRLKNLTLKWISL